MKQAAHTLDELKEAHLAEAVRFFGPREGWTTRIRNRYYTELGLLIVIFERADKIKADAKP